MKIKLLIVALAGLIFAGCTNSGASLSPSTSYQEPTPQKEAIFHKTMKEVALSTRDNPKYNRMALETPEKKEWFKTLMYRLWDRQITRSQFISEGLAKYPTHQYEFAFIANGFQQRS
ncbi:MAG: hypothetical protein B6D54_04765 [Epsilonproteobacteria bacterium 4484_65]|nr:MAG: hypothetical protein B6D54_04765 [Epsilonproteobacteria bacterium 4484_65]